MSKTTKIDILDSGECVHVQFVGQYKGDDVIYDAVIYTLRLHHSSMVYEMAVDQVKKSFPSYLPPEERGTTYKNRPQRRRRGRDGPDRTD